MLIIVGRSNRSQLRPESCRSGAAAAETSQRLLKDRDSQALRSSRSIFEGRYRSRCTRANTSRVRNDVVTIALLVEHRFPSPVPAPYGARCAVAFWGSGAVEQLFGSWLHEAAQIRRDIPMGATNPDELRNLGAPSNPCLKHLERLHGKVYISEREPSSRRPMRQRTSYGCLEQAANERRAPGMWACTDWKRIARSKRKTSPSNRWTGSAPPHRAWMGVSSKTSTSKSIAISPHAMPSGSPRIRQYGKVAFGR